MIKHNYTNKANFWVIFIMMMSYDVTPLLNRKEVVLWSGSDLLHFGLIEAVETVKLIWCRWQIGVGFFLRVNSDRETDSQIMWRCVCVFFVLLGGWGGGVKQRFSEGIRSVSLDQGAGGGRASWERAGTSRCGYLHWITMKQGSFKGGANCDWQVSTILSRCGLISCLIL